MVSVFAFSFSTNLVGRSRCLHQMAQAQTKSLPRADEGGAERRAVDGAVDVEIVEHRHIAVLPPRARASDARISLPLRVACDAAAVFPVPPVVTTTYVDVAMLGEQFGPALWLKPSTPLIRWAAGPHRVKIFAGVGAPSAACIRRFDDAG